MVFLMKFALISHALPPEPSGQAIMLYRLLEDIDPADYCLISKQSFFPNAYKDDRLCTLPGKYYILPTEFQVRWGNWYGWHLLRGPFNIVARILMRASNIAKIVKRERCRAIVACSGDLHDLPAGLLASRLARVPFYSYIFDYYKFQRINRFERAVAQIFEWIVLRCSAGVIVPNEFMHDEYRRRYGVKSTIIRNPCEISELNALNDDSLKSLDGEGQVRIVYTGRIYEAHYDAFRNMLSAIEQVGQSDVKLHLYTAEKPIDLARQGIKGAAVVLHDHCSPSEVVKVQRQADILFLPLAFSSPYPKVINTSSPGKIGEYLTTGRPILVHAPSESFVSWYFRRNECGVVVDRDDPMELAGAIQQILTDHDLRVRIGTRARDLALSEWGVDVARSRFMRVIQNGSVKKQRYSCGETKL
jgi:glycosyltransferase involved in cell wall biosynthesis